MSELYLNIAFSVGINSSAVEFTNASVTFSNIFGMLFGVIIIVGPITLSIQLAKKIKQLHMKSKER